MKILLVYPHIQNTDHLIQALEALHLELVVTDNEQDFLDLLSQKFDVILFYYPSSFLPQSLENILFISDKASINDLHKSGVAAKYFLNLPASSLDIQNALKPFRKEKNDLDDPLLFLEPLSELSEKPLSMENLLQTPAIESAPIDEKGVERAPLSETQIESFFGTDEKLKEKINFVAQEEEQSFIEIKDPSVKIELLKDHEQVKENTFDLASQNQPLPSSDVPASEIILTGLEDLTPLLEKQEKIAVATLPAAEDPKLDPVLVSSFHENAVAFDVQESNPISHQQQSLGEKNFQLQQNLDEALLKLMQYESTVSELENNFRKKLQYAEAEIHTRKEQIYTLEKSESLLRKQIQGLKEKNIQDLKTVRVREKQLEASLEILKKDTEALLQSREMRIIDLKRQVDMLEFNNSLLEHQLDSKKQDVARLKDKIAQALNDIEKIRSVFIQESP